MPDPDMRDLEREIDRYLWNKFGIPIPIQIPKDFTPQGPLPPPPWQPPPPPFIQPIGKGGTWLPPGGWIWAGTF